MLKKIDAKKRNAIGYGSAHEKTAPIYYLAVWHTSLCAKKRASGEFCLEWPSFGAGKREPPRDGGLV